MPVEIENRSTLEASLRREINLFIGAGFSVLAKDAEGKALPTGTELVAELCAEFGQPALVSQNLPLVSQILKSKDKARFNEFLKKRFGVGEYDKRYLSLTKLKVSRIFTTNIDDLIPKLFGGNGEKYLNDLIQQGATFRDRAAVEYLPLHGMISYPDADFTFTPIEIATAFSNNPTQFQYLVTCLNKAPTLFLGYSLQDAGSLQSLNLTFSNGVQDRARWIQLRKKDEAAVDYFRSLGFSVIIGETEEVLQYLDSLSDSLASAGKGSLTQESFLSGRIPTIQETAVRPISDYFKGLAPSWHDVISRRIPTRAAYGSLLDFIDSSKNVLISAIPVSGKSTLLMQAAAYYDTEKVKLFEDAITVEKARSISNCVAGYNAGKVVVFIDNVGDSVDALDVLTSNPNIQVVGADRAVNIEFGSHRFDSKRFVRFDCSDLDERDFSKIFEAIPPALRTSRMVVPSMAGESRLGFEVI